MNAACLLRLNFRNFSRDNAQGTALNDINALHRCVFLLPQIQQPVAIMGLDPALQEQGRDGQADNSGRFLLQRHTGKPGIKHFLTKFTLKANPDALPGLGAVCVRNLIKLFVLCRPCRHIPIVLSSIWHVRKEAVIRLVVSTGHTCANSMKPHAAARPLFSPPHVPASSLADKLRLCRETARPLHTLMKRQESSGMELRSETNTGHPWD